MTAADQAPIYFSGAPDTEDSDEPVWPPEEETLLQYASTVWVHEHEPPTELPALAEFDFASLIPEFREFLNAGGRSPKRGMTVEEHWVTGQLANRQPLTCLLNAAQPSQDLGRISRARRLSPAALVAELEAFYGNPKLESAYPDSPVPTFPLLSLTYDGKVGHAVVVWTLHNNRVHYQDPWPTRSLLCADNNVAGVAAQESALLANGWSLAQGEFGRVVYQVLLPPSPDSVAPYLELTQKEREMAKHHEKVMHVLAMAQASRPGRSVPRAPDMRTISRLVFASKFGRVWEVKTALLHGYDVNEPSEFGTPLHVAAENGHLEVVKILVAHGADRNTRNPEGKTPLDLAVSKGHQDIVAFLRSRAWSYGGA